MTDSLINRFKRESNKLTQNIDVDYFNVNQEKVNKDSFELIKDKIIAFKNKQVNKRKAGSLFYKIYLLNYMKEFIFKYLDKTEEKIIVGFSFTDKVKFSYAFSFILSPGFWKDVNDEDKVVRGFFNKVIFQDYLKEDNLKLLRETVRPYFENQTKFFSSSESLNNKMNFSRKNNAVKALINKMILRTTKLHGSSEIK